MPARRIHMKKKLLPLVMVIIMVASLAVPAFADDYDDYVGLHAEYCKYVFQHSNWFADLAFAGYVKGEFTIASFTEAESIISEYSFLHADFFKSYKNDGGKLSADNPPEIIQEGIDLLKSGLAGLDRLVLKSDVMNKQNELRMLVDENMFLNMDVDEFTKSCYDELCALIDSLSHPEFVKAVVSTFNTNLQNGNNNSLKFVVTVVMSDGSSYKVEHAEKVKGGEKGSKIFDYGEYKVSVAWNDNNKVTKCEVI